MSKIIFLHVAFTFLMTGVIWVIQLLHYPSFRFFPEQDFPQKMKWHQFNISWIVLPAMIIELFTGGFICWKLKLSDQIWNINLMLLILIWISTLVLQGPTHQKLLAGKNLRLIDFLIQTNWIRVLLWNVRSGIFIWLL